MADKLANDNLKSRSPALQSRAGLITISSSKTLALQRRDCATFSGIYSQPSQTCQLFTGVWPSLDAP